MERANGEVRDREKVMRGLKIKNTPILKGYQIYHNYMRPHEGLNGKTPAEACGIKVEGDNKWITLIQNASHTEHQKIMVLNFLFFQANYYKAIVFIICFWSKLLCS
ncbi:Integrase, catalytic region (modular protein) [Candidatus Methanoperedens nitroreducens]|uniref:Integrase, catalytic region (Modular protein) n=1 Tax=Candidatus Methanoperedens nitratireducens TaxID=1392998 RepID=A0A284VSY0_9EURY|nr:Integrase, catalytic region (modular protein) [Candidatus Methanoperedens nitroreducens]